MLGSLFTLATIAVSDTTPAPAFTVRVDERRHEVILRLGPFPLPCQEQEDEHAEGHEGMDHGHGPQLPSYRFAWPVSGWARGFRVEISDPAGKPLSRRLLHHVNLSHLDRRSLTFPMFEKIMAAGQETDAVMLPKTVGVWIAQGTEMALSSMWTNETGEDLDGVVMELVLPYLPPNTVPRPTEVRPFSMDVGFRPGLTAGFDLDTGRVEFSREFEVAVDGRLLGIGGHMHDYGYAIELRDGETGKVLVPLKGKLDPDGKLLGVSRKVLGATGPGLRLRAGRRYVVVAKYHNTTGRRLKLGAMAAMAGIFTPDRPELWPALDKNDPVNVAELEALGQNGWVTVPDAPAKSRVPKPH